MTEAAEGTPLWQPSEEFKENANISRYMEWLDREKGLSFDDYGELWEWSVNELEEFWASVWEYFEVQTSRPYERVLGSHEMPGAKWFEGAELNYAEHVFRNANDRLDEPAVMQQSELRPLSEVTWRELQEQVGALAAGMKDLGVERGDRVVAYMPNVPEAIVAFLACASLGAVWSSCSPDFGAGSVVDRFTQIEPKVLFAVDGYRYGGKDHDRIEVVARLQEEIPSLEKTVVLPYLNEEPETSGLENVVLWDDLLSGHEGAELEFEQVPFDHPLWVLYSSGTTGLPKAIVQGQGGILLEHLKKMHLHLDAQEGDRVFWFTTTGWMMWNFLVGVLLTPASIVLYDGSPGHPDAGVLWDLAERAEITTFGTSAAYIASSMKAGLEPGAGRNLSALDAVGSTDSTINRGGVRMGTSEIYRAVLAHDEVVDALVVDVPREGGENWMPLFVVLREGTELDHDLRARIGRGIREDCSPRHVPNEVRAIAEVPRTLSGKVLEVPVKRILMGEDPERAASRDSLANPSALDAFVELATPS